MKKKIHPDVHPVIFKDGDNEFVSQSTKKSNETRDVDGVAHFVIPIDISSATHPFYTGKQRVEVKGGRVARFNRRYGRAKKGE